MILINENKIRVGIFGMNTEKVLILNGGMGISEDKDEKGKVIHKLRFKLIPVSYEDPTQKGVIEILENIEKVFIPEGYIIDDISALKLLAKNITAVFNLEEGKDFNIIGYSKWQHEDMITRITIPSYIIPKNKGLLGLIDHVEDLIESKNAFEYQSGNNYIFYFKGIQPEHLKILQQEEIVNSILIENK